MKFNSKIDHYFHLFKNPDLCHGILNKINKINPLKKPIRIMEVCGTHTRAIFRHGIRSILPENISLLSGPGCPICVTDQHDIDLFIQAARLPKTIVTTFGDMMRVPGCQSSLMIEKANGHAVQVVQSAMDAIHIAKNHPDQEVIFLGVGFETTAPTIAATIHDAHNIGIRNFSIISSHKCIVPGLMHLLSLESLHIDGLLLPGHVSSIVGVNVYYPIVNQFKIPSVIAGFEPVDILYAIEKLVDMIIHKKPDLENAYSRVVTSEGNTKALDIIREYFIANDVMWRGLGMIPNSGLELRPNYYKFDAIHKFNLSLAQPDLKPSLNCSCGDILIGAKQPPECLLFLKQCTPEHPIGPCMVSSEGSCGLYARFSITS